MFIRNFLESLPVVELDRMIMKLGYSRLVIGDGHIQEYEKRAVPVATGSGSTKIISKAIIAFLGGKSK